MIVILVVAGVFLTVVFIRRRGLHSDLVYYLDQIEKIVNEMHGLVEAHGPTVGQMERAGVYGRYMELWEKGGKYYCLAVPLAAKLMFSPIGPLLLKRQIVDAYNSVGLFKGCSGSLNAFGDLIAGKAMFSNYYPNEHLRGMRASLAVALWLP